MVKNYYKTKQSIDEWALTIEKKFHHVSITESIEIANILGIEDSKEHEKIRKASIIAFGKKIGVLSFDDAVRKLGITPIDLDYTENKFLIASYKLSIIIEALNEGWKPDWTDSTYKYYNYFYMKDGTFSYYYSAYISGSVHVPSALWFKTEILAYYCAHQFIDLYKDLYLK
jgi:hypothetical protein